MRDGKAHELVAGRDLHPSDQALEVVLVHALMEVKGGGLEIRCEAEPLMEGSKRSSVHPIAHLKLDVRLVIRVVLKLERGEELKHELLIAITLNAPEGRSEPNPIYKLYEPHVDPKYMEGLKVEPASVFASALS